MTKPINGEDYKIRYFDSLSFSIFILISVALFVFLGMLVWIAGIFGIIFSIFALYKYYKVLNYVVSINTDFIVVRPFKIKRIKIKDVIKLCCEDVGFAKSKDVVIYLYYYDSGKNVEKSIFLNFRIFYKSKIITVLNLLKDKINIDSESFIKIGIVKKGDVFVEG